MGLFDIAPSTVTESVTVLAGTPGETQIEVRGLSNTQLAKIMRRFPEYGKFFAGMSGIDPDTLSPETALKTGKEYNPEAALQAFLLMQEAMPAIIAAGCGYANDTKAEGVAEFLDDDDKLALFMAIMALTKPKAPKEPTAPLAGAPAAGTGNTGGSTQPLN